MLRLRSLASARSTARLPLRLRYCVGVLVVALQLPGCSSDTFDLAQVPRITVTPVVAAPVVRFSWTPAGAQLVRVYRGTTAQQGASEDLMWSVAATGPNSIASGLEYGASAPAGGTIELAAKALVLGQPYTVQISRLDPAGSRSVINAQPRYVNSQVFTINALIPNP